MCFGQPRFGATASPKARIGAFIVNLIVGVGQAFTVLFCLVGWGWSIWWGITMIRLASKLIFFKFKFFLNSNSIFLVRVSLKKSIARAYFYMKFSTFVYV